VTISSNVSKGDKLCPGEEITITCQTRDSDELRWRIRSDIQTTFFSHQPIGTTVSLAMNPNYSAILTNNTIEDGEPVLVSELRIKISPQIPISCSDSANTSTIAILFQLLGMLETKITAMQLLYILLCRTKFDSVHLYYTDDVSIMYPFLLR
jgi:hypothetical protein